MTPAGKWYIELLKKNITGLLHKDPGQHLSSQNVFNQTIRENGEDWPNTAETMIGLKRINNIQYCIEQIVANGVRGDLIETGVWRGGACIFMRALLKVYGITDRTVWVADSFEGLPKVNVAQYPKDANLGWLHTVNYLAVSLEEVKKNFERYDLLDGQVRFLKGWFKDTLAQAPIKNLALLRLDGDLYESTMDSLKALYPKLSVGGYIIIDDYQITACRSAVEDYRKQHSITESIIPIDNQAVFWKKTKN